MPGIQAIAAYLATRPGVKPDEPLILVRGGRRITARVVTKAVASATRLHELGVDPLVVQDLLGHESVATTEIYL